MNDTATYLFHCGQCGKLYSSEVDFSDDRECPHCGLSPSPPPHSTPPALDAKVDHLVVVVGQTHVGHGHRQRRTRAVYKVLLAWLIVMAVIFGVAQWMRSQNELSNADIKRQDATRDTFSVIDTDRQLLDEIVPACRVILAKFLKSETVAERLPLVLARDGIVDSMERFYAENELMQADPDTMILTASTMADLPEGRTVLTQWETPEGATFDAAFRQHEDKWALDWCHFVRYSDMLWSQFLAGSGDKIAEFRLHARRRLASDEDPNNGIGVVLSAPMRRHLKEAGYSQSMMGIPLTEDDGKLLESAFDRAAVNMPLFGANYCDVNPEGMIRLRVRVERIDEEGGLKYRIAKVVACHWYDSKATGIE